MELTCHIYSFTLLLDLGRLAVVCILIVTYSSTWPSQNLCWRQPWILFPTFIDSLLPSLMIPFCESAMNFFQQATLMSLLSLTRSLSMSVVSVYTHFTVASQPFLTLLLYICANVQLFTISAVVHGSGATLLRLRYSSATAFSR